MEALWIIDSTSHKRRAEKATCEKCGKEYLRRLGNPRNQKYCSLKCGRDEKGTSKNIPVICNYCGKSFLIAPQRYNAKKNKVFYCSPDCGHKVVKKYEEKHCLTCNSLFYAKRKQKFCSQKCKSGFKVKQYIEGTWDGNSTNGEISPVIKRYVFGIHNYKCRICGWSEKHPITGNVIIQLHHKDGNYKNNKIENLDVLCPNHHALTETYGSLNKNGGRKYRKKYYLTGQ